MPSKQIEMIAKGALVIALIALVLPEQQTTTSVAGTKWIVNNTNLAPSFPGEVPGTGERVQGVTYWANNSPIELFVWGHAASLGQTAEIHLFINGTKVSDTSGRAVGVAETSNKTIIATIPQYSNYSIEITNAHHYEWREYPILTGNVTTNITAGGCNGNCTYNYLGVNALYKNDTNDDYLDNIFLNSLFEYHDSNGNFSIWDIGHGNYTQFQVYDGLSANQSNIYESPTQIILTSTDTWRSSITVDHNNITLDANNITTIDAGNSQYVFNSTSLDMTNQNLSVRNISAYSLNVTDGMNSSGCHGCVLTFVGSFTRDLTTASGTQTVTGLPFKPKSIQFIYTVDGTTKSGSGFSDFTTSFATYNTQPTCAGCVQYSGASIRIQQTAGDAIGYYGSATNPSFGSFQIAWTKVGLSTGTLQVGYIAFG